jgi:hypothetical protein
VWTCRWQPRPQLGPLHAGRTGHRAGGADNTEMLCSKKPLWLGERMGAGGDGGPWSLSTTTHTHTHVTLPAEGCGSTGPGELASSLRSVNHKLSVYSLPLPPTPRGKGGRQRQLLPEWFWDPTILS